MKLTILPNGNLELSLEPTDDKEDVISWEFHWERMFDEAGAIGNGWTMIAPEWIAALTEAPIVSNDCIIGDDGKPSHVGDVWWFPNYAVENPVQTLADTGRVVFKKVI